MTLATPFLYVIGGIFLGLCVPGFRKHPLLGSLAIVIGGTLITLAATHTTLTVPPPSDIHIHFPPVPGSSSTVTPATPSASMSTL